MPEEKSLYESEWQRDKVRFTTEPEHPRDTSSEPGPLARQFNRLASSLIDAETPARVLERIVEAVLEAIPGADVVSVTLRSADGQFYTPVYSDPLAVELDHVQYEHGEGPCITAADPEGPAMAVSEDLSSETRWPRFASAAVERGLYAVCAPALLRHEKIGPPGALNIFARRAHGFSDEDRTQAMLLATHASLALAHTRAVDRWRLQSEKMQHAIDSRDFIGQAKGILMSRQGFSADEAFDMLRRTSQQLNVKLAQLAATLTERHNELD